MFAVRPESPAEGPEVASDESVSRPLRFVHQQHLTANSKVVLIADIGKSWVFSVINKFNYKNITQLLTNELLLIVVLHMPVYLFFFRLLAYLN